MKLLKTILICILTAAHLSAYPVGWPPKWLDLPHDDYAALLNVNPVPEFETLHTLLDEYHNYSKTEYDLLEKRIHKLDQIHAYMTTWREQTSDPLIKKHLKSLITVTQNKSWYLTQLKQGYASGRLSLDYCADVIEELTHINTENTGDHIIYLHRDDMFNPYVVEYWGDFWLEYIDPCHRNLWSYLGLWKKQQSDTPFFLWLEEQNLSINVPFMHYLSEEELAPCYCDIEEGKLLYRATKKPVGDKTPEDLLFAVTLERDVLVIEGTPTIHHTSITHGRPVLAAGRLVVEDGRITLFSLESGHHLPSIEDGKAMIHTMQDMQIDLPPHTTVASFNPFGMHRMNLQAFMDTETQRLETIQK